MIRSASEFGILDFYNFALHVFLASARMEQSYKKNKIIKAKNPKLQIHL